MGLNILGVVAQEQEKKEENDYSRDIFSKFTPSTISKAQIESPLHSTQIANFSNSAITTLINADVSALIMAANSFHQVPISTAVICRPDMTRTAVNEPICSWDDDDYNDDNNYDGCNNINGGSVEKKQPIPQKEQKPQVQQVSFVIIILLLLSFTIY